jgi:hypothetical protein
VAGTENVPRKTHVEMVDESTTVAAQKPRGSKAYARSRVSNGNKLLAGVDGRTLVARRFRDLVSQITSDQGGAGQLAEARLQLIRRFSAAAVIAESMEARLANGEAIDIAEHALLCSTLVRLSARIGINRTAREIVPSLAQYLETKAHEAAE